MPATVKSAVAESPTGSPVSVIVYAPGGTFAIVKVAVTNPFAMEHVLDVMELPDTEQVESLAEKPEASTWTGVPTGA